MPVRTVVQRGPKGKKAVAFAVDWPGWARGARTADEAVELLTAYQDRYRTVAAAAGFADELDRQLGKSGRLKVVADEEGTPSTDFWGISFSPCSLETEPMGATELERKLALLQACWAHFDAVRAKVSPQLQKGPRGGGRDREEIVGHVMRVESGDFAKRVGVPEPDVEPTTKAALRKHRTAFLAAMRAYDAGEGKRMRSGNLPFLVRHTAFHTMDHAWEMEDKDLSGAAG